ncbi:hypothetical protein CPB84DRAFT_1685147 [Gymnopilus junonius]|uniref:Uncharacterized protein n=1 Tax=Gymnopilus junonius TaxID=109634 RepID=A0A9P5TIX7_GYMJU|nr:hypothetical protein CPB84DRAFT_1685147 [Gymnopilus junonius]
MQKSFLGNSTPTTTNVPFGVTYEKIGTIQRRLAWPLHKDDTLSRSGRSTDLHIYFALVRLHVVYFGFCKLFFFFSKYSKPMI